MTRTTVSVLVLAAALAAGWLASPLLADIAPPPPPPPLPSSPPATQMQLTAATVVANLKLAPTTQPAEASAASAAPAEPARTVQADVSCDFELTCLKAENGKAPIEIYFPVCAADQTDVKVTRFDAKVAGATVETKNDKPWRLLAEGPLTAEQQKALDAMKPYEKQVTLQNRKRDQAPFTAYRWDATAVTGETMKVHVEYQLLLPVDHWDQMINVNNTWKKVKPAYALFPYVLRSGAAWGKPIKAETVTVNAEGLWIFPTRDLIGSRNYRTSVGEHRVVVELTDATPPQNLQVEVRLEKPDELRYLPKPRAK